jgi:signal peptidase I
MAAGVGGAGQDVAGAAAGIEPEGGRTGLRRALVVTGAVLGALVVLAFLSGLLVATKMSGYWIPSAAMSPTLQPGDRVLVSKRADRGSDVARGDIVVFPDPGGTALKVVKRVVGLPGETVSFDGGRLLIDGSPVDEPYLATGTTTEVAGPNPCPASDPCAVPAGQVWVMGDNRSNSKDSRWFGPVPQSTIIGRVDFRYWPAGRVGTL